MSLKEMAQETLVEVQKAGTDKAQATFTRSEVHELELQGQSIHLCRTYFKDNFSVKAVHQNRQAETQLNRWDKDSLSQMLVELKAGLEASPEDSAYDILNSPIQKNLSQELRSPDLSSLIEKMNVFIDWTKHSFPEVHFESSPIQFIKTSQVLTNSSGLCLEANEDYYSGFVMFTAKNKVATSSFNYVDFASRHLPQELQQLTGIKDLFRFTIRELEPAVSTGPIKNLIITPYALPSFLSFFLRQISTGALLSGASVFQDKVGQKVLSEQFSLKTLPQHPDFASSYPYTADGALTQNGDIFNQGTLSHYLLDLYGSLKLKLPLTNFTATNLYVPEGNMPLSQMISDLDHGLLLTRFSGGNPAANGDFSAVAKNSFLIKKGEIVGPVKETMISGNMVKLFQNIKSVSSDSINFGTRKFPWIQADL